MVYPDDNSILRIIVARLQDNEQPVLVNLKVISCSRKLGSQEKNMRNQGIQFTGWRNSELLGWVFQPFSEGVGDDLTTTLKILTQNMSADPAMLLAQR